MDPKRRRLDAANSPGASTPEVLSSAPEPVELDPTQTPIPVNIDDEGDLILSVGQDTPGGRTDFRVCSSALRRASPVFKAMLFGGWIESKPEQRNSSRQGNAAVTPDWTIPLPDDRAEPMEAILRMAHGDFMSGGASRFTLEQVYQLLIVAKKYQMAHLTSPYTHTWMSRLDTSGFALWGRTMKWLVRKAYLAYEVGNEAVFAEMVAVLIVRVKANDEGHLVLNDVDDKTDLDTLEHFGPLDLAGK